MKKVGLSPDFVNKIMYSKDGVVSKALTLIGKLQNKYGFKPKFYNLASPCPSPERDLPTIYEEDSGFTEHDWVCKQLP